MSISDYNSALWNTTRLERAFDKALPTRGVSKDQFNHALRWVGQPLGFNNARCMK